MDPIIPEKEERDSRQQVSTRQKLNGIPPDLKGWILRLALPGVMLLLLVIQYGSHSRELSNLRSQIEALRTSPPASNTHQPGTATAHESGQQDDALAQHTALIRTLEQRMATLIVEMDRLRTATSDNFALLGAAPLRGAGSLDELRESLEAIKTQVATLMAHTDVPDATVDQGELDRLDSLLDSQATLLQQLTHRIASAEERLEAGMNLADTPHHSSLDELRRNLEGLQASLKALDERVVTTQQEYSAALAQQQEQMTRLDRQLEAGGDNEPAAVEFLALRQQVSALSQRLDQVDKELATKGNASGNGFALQQASLNSVDGASLNELTQRIDNAISRLEHQESTLNSWRAEVEERLLAHDLQVAQASQARGPDTAEMASIRRTLALLKKQHPFVKFPSE